MKKVEIGVLICGIASLISSLFLVAGSTELFMITACLLAMIYFYFGFALFNNIRLRQIFKKSSYTDLSSLRIFFSILVGVSLSQMTMAILFRVLVLTGSEEMLVIACPLMAFTLLVSLFFRNDSSFIKPIYAYLIPAFVIGIVLYASGRDSFIRFKFRNYPEYAEMYIEHKNDPLNEELAKQVRDAGTKIYEK